MPVLKLQLEDKMLNIGILKKCRISCIKFLQKLSNDSFDTEYKMFGPRLEKFDEFLAHLSHRLK